MEWKPLNTPPQKSGYVLLAGYHHNIPKVIYGHCKIYGDGTATYKEDIYNGQGASFTHWMELPAHPNGG